MINFVQLFLMMECKTKYYKEIKKKYIHYRKGHIMNNFSHKLSRYSNELDIHLKELMHLLNLVNMLK